MSTPMNRGSLSRILSVRGHHALAFAAGRLERQHAAADAGGYVAVSELALVCGIDAHTLDTRHRPDAWGSPAEFKLVARRILVYARAALPQLANALAEAGQAQAATALRTWIAAGSGGKGGSQQPETGNARIATAPARTPEGGWAKEWEDAHQ